MLFRIYFYLLILLPLTVGLLSQPSAAEEETLTVKVEIRPSKATIGDRLHYLITLKRHPDTTLLSKVEFNHPDFLVKNRTPFAQEEKRGYLWEGTDYELVTFNTGTIEIDPVEIDYIDPKGNKLTAQSNSVSLVVESVLKSNEEYQDIRDVKGLHSLIPFLQSDLTKWLAVSSGVLCLFIIFLIYRRRYYQKRVQYLLDPYEEAAKQLNHLIHLTQSGQLTAHQTKEIYEKLSSVFRRFLSRSLSLDTQELTTREMMSRLGEQNLPSEIFEKINSLLKELDPVRFAGVIPLSDQIMDDIRICQQIIELIKKRSTPSPQEEESLNSSRAV